MCVEEQNMLGTEEGINKFLGIIGEEDLREEVKALFDQYSTSVKRWDAFVSFFKNQMQQVLKAKHVLLNIKLYLTNVTLSKIVLILKLTFQGSRKWRKTPHLIEEIMIQYTYPRLDINVTKGMNHLLKSPFCIHPKTGKVCVPINPKVVDNFDPETVPKIADIIEEINTYDAKEISEQGENPSNVKRIKDYKKTSLNKPLHVFLEFLRGLEISQKGEKLIKSGELD